MKHTTIGQSGYNLCSLCAGGPFGSGVFAHWLLSKGGGDPFGAEANCQGGCGGVAVITGVCLTDALMLQ